ncbi:glycosyltransferase involved in cell wall biosynthesis [Mesocricetibacter intestinalis]|uniref:Glycosyltransferase involved in cell wall biosynthesis n=1 Tax=Mesocricetibacter intestinalis TaxID=1521930 RepID=A0A4R6VC59_9PAST|nr:glycosyltransferase family 2 protein [Mesocricetibacter intestinalis]TDQ57679.1 glycosyltransferase involved in cell wall biosynthesis [Mesocricetibacter intestinalis]
MSGNSAINENYRPVALIPHYNHADKIGGVIARLLAFGLPVLVVDDGSDQTNRALLKTLEQCPGVMLVYRPHNGGKGAAMKIAFRRALASGFSHGLQLDADGQHHLEDVPSVLEKSRTNPTALICGRPCYGSDVPKGRFYGRKITNFWIAVNTLSFDIPDGMCGFRLYPLQAVNQVIQRYPVGDGMDFDTDILVRLHWQNSPMIWFDTPVRYHPGGVSHFRALRDNWLISKMHARLFFGMLRRLCRGKNI